MTEEERNLFMDCARTTAIQILREELESRDLMGQIAFNFCDDCCQSYCVNDCFWATMRYVELMKIIPEFFVKGWLRGEEESLLFCRIKFSLFGDNEISQMDEYIIRDILRENKDYLEFEAKQIILNWIQEFVLEKEILETKINLTLLKQKITDEIFRKNGLEVVVGEHFEFAQEEVGRKILDFCEQERRRELREKTMTKKYFQRLVYLNNGKYAFVIKSKKEGLNFDQGAFLVIDGDVYKRKKYDLEKINLFVVE